jgi:outer membrane receptor protein involved in Fe transport
LGLYDFWQRDHQLFSLLFNDASNPNFLDRQTISGDLVEEFIEDKFKPASWITLSGGVRQSYFSSDITENITAPRAGVAIQIPRLNWVLRAFYGHFYQPPPLLTVTGTGSLAELFGYLTSPAAAQGFEPLHGELDKEYQFGVDIPARGWSLDMDYFKTRASNFFDHNNVGASNVFLPLTIAEAVVQGWETTLRSPRLWRRAQMHLAYSNQLALAQGPVTGGIVNPLAPGFFSLDHDQTNTLNVGLDVTLPLRSFLSGNVSYGSGFANGLYDPTVLPPIPSHLAGETTVDLSVGKSIGERITASVTALNVTNKHLLIDNSLTFGGFHFNNPREIYAELRYRFHY